MSRTVTKSQGDKGTKKTAAQAAAGNKSGALQYAGAADNVDRDIDAALMQLLDMEPVATNRLIARAMLSGKYGRTRSLRAMLRKMLFDVALQLNETTAIRGVTNFRDMG